ncbi:MAG: signal recognition particle-docking protein FtsY [Eubacteriales bacterium]|nr:signal recognition particle-docking protein FtsY [Eubacteriales bacterium]
MCEEKKQGFFRRLVAGLAKTRDNIVSGMDYVFNGFTHIDEEFYEELEEILIMGDLGVQTTADILDRLRTDVAEQKVKSPSACKDLLKDSIKAQMLPDENAYRFETERSVVVVIGVNGVGKTTSIGKLAAQLKEDGRKVVLAAADTFRAAAIDQLKLWGDRSGVDVIAQNEGSDPAAVIYDAVAASKARNADVLICDTAGRLHNKKNLMNELGKIDRVIQREYGEAYRENLIVVDATTGQNALNQVRQFHELMHVDGVILTKLDGTAKGGIAIAIEAQMGIPVKYIGVGEAIGDLQKFDADRFIEALFETGATASTSEESEGAE